MSKKIDSARHIEKARQHIMKEEWQKAISEYNKAIKILDQPFTHILRAVAYGALLGTEMQYFDQKTTIARDAMPDFDICIDILSRSGDLPDLPFGLEFFYFQRASAYVYLHNPRRAIEDLDQALSIDPMESAFWSSKGGIYLDQLDDPEMAKLCFQKCISIKPSASAFIFLAWCYIDLEDEKNCMRYIHLAVSMDADVLKLERNHNIFRERQWKLIRTRYLVNRYR